MVTVSTIDSKMIKRNLRTLRRVLRLTSNKIDNVREYFGGLYDVDFQQSLNRRHAVKRAKEIVRLLNQVTPPCRNVKWELGLGGSDGNEGVGFIAV